MAPVPGHEWGTGFDGYGLDIGDCGWFLESSLGPFFQHQFGGALGFLVEVEFGDRG
jgi:hypothetical protein